MLKASFKVLTDINKIMTKEAERTRKAAAIAVRVEAARLRKDGIVLLHKGGLGLSPLSKLKREKGKGKRKGKRKAPLAGFARGFIYLATPITKSARVGFVGNTAGTKWQQKILKKSIPGYFWLYSPEKIEKLHKAGIHLRKGTTGGRVPGRNILKSLVDREGENKIARNISQNFDAKMRGEKI